MKRVVTLLAAGCALFVGCSVIDDPALAAGGAALALSVQARPAQDPPASPDVPGVPPGIYKQIARRAEAFFGEPTLGGSRTIFADQLAARLAAGEKIFIIDVRDAAAYAAGHIPGAVNMPLKTLFEPETLAQIPADGTPVVTTCVTGHTASMAMSGLGTLGYDAYVLRFGMMGWNASTSMKVGSSAGAPQLILGFGGPLATGSEP
jgi:rhodanese-related sulfurtransferase